MTQQWGENHICRVHMYGEKTPLGWTITNSIVGDDLYVPHNYSIVVVPLFCLVSIFTLKNIYKYIYLFINRNKIIIIKLNKSYRRGCGSCRFMGISFFFGK
jgi:hypothetical protein